MRTRLEGILSVFGLAGALLFAGVPSAAGSVARWSQSDGGLDELLQERSPGELEQLLERLEKLRRLEPEERRSLLNRARALHRLEKDLHRLAPDELRRSLHRDPDGAPRMWRKHFEKEAKTHGRRRSERLPPELRQRLREAEPRERMRILRRIESKRKDDTRTGLHRLGRALGLSEPEVDRLEKLPPHELCAAYLDLRRRLIERSVKHQGLPDAVQAEDWEELRELSDIEFFQALREKGSCGRDFLPSRRTRKAEPRGGQPKGKHRPFQR